MGVRLYCDRCKEDIPKGETMVGIQVTDSIYFNLRHMGGPSMEKYFCQKCHREVVDEIKNLMGKD